MKWKLRCDGCVGVALRLFVLPCSLRLSALGFVHEVLVDTSNTSRGVKIAVKDVHLTREMSI